MFLEFYGLREQPFGVTPDPRFLYLSPMHREALASLYYGIEAGRGFLSMIAKPGMGKTTLLFQLLEEFRNAARTAFLFQTQCDSREFIRFLLAELGIESKEQDRVKMHEEFNAVLLREMKAGKRFVVVIDEAQNLDDSVLETVRLLSNFETPRTKLMQIVLSGQPELADKLARPNLSQLRQRISIVSRLEPLAPQYIQDYIQHRLKVAGYSGPQMFLPDAVDEIIKRSEGIPRTINNLCFNAMSLGYAIGKNQIDRSLIEEITGDLDLQKIMSHPRAPQFTIPFNSPIFAATAKWGTLGYKNPAEAAVPQGETPARTVPAPEPIPVAASESSIDSELRDLVAELNASASVSPVSTVNAPEPVTGSAAPEINEVGPRVGQHQQPVISKPVQPMAASNSVISRRVSNSQRPPLQVVSKREGGKTARKRGWAKPLILTILAIDVALGAIYIVHRRANMPSHDAIHPAAASVFSTPASTPDDHQLVSFDTPPPSSDTPSRISVSADVMNDNLVHQVEPTIPDDATDTKGSVSMKANIARDGSVESVQVVNGDPVLARAATDAVRQWRYKPYLLNGEPVGVQTDVTVNFGKPEQGPAK